MTQTTTSLPNTAEDWASFIYVGDAKKLRDITGMSNGISWCCEYGNADHFLTPIIELIQRQARGEVI